MPLTAIAYVSSALRELSDPELEALLAKARARNQQHEVTGALLYHDGSFLQYIEGPEEGLDVIYRHIMRAPEHYDIVELMRSPVAQRSFSDWEMGFTRAPESTMLQLANVSWRRQVQSAAPNSSIGLTLLMQFWRSNGGTMTPPGS